MDWVLVLRFMRRSAGRDVGRTCQAKFAVGGFHSWQSLLEVCQNGDYTIVDSNSVALARLVCKND